MLKSIPVLCYSFIDSTFSEEMCSMIKRCLSSINKDIDISIFQIFDGNDNYKNQSKIIFECINYASINTSFNPLVFENVIRLINLRNINIEKFNENSINNPSSADYKFILKLVDNYSLKDFHQSVTGKILLKLPNTITTIVGGLVGAHGIASPECKPFDSDYQFAFFIQDYEAIIWHEFLHLLGANDHYDINSDKHESICLEKNDGKCVMHWHPQSESQICNKTVLEIKGLLNACSVD